MLRRGALTALKSALAVLHPPASTLATLPPLLRSLHALPSSGPQPWWKQVSNLNGSMRCWPEAAGVRHIGTMKSRKGVVDTSALKFWKPTSPGQRFRVTIRRRGVIWDGPPLKALSVGVKRSAGRNNAGRITIWHRGGGHKKKLRLVDFNRRVTEKPAVVERLEYDPNRSAYLALIKYQGVEQGQPYAYIVAPQDLAPGDTVVSGDEAPIAPGNTLPLSRIPVGIPIHNLELRPNGGAVVCRAAGCGAIIMNKQQEHAIVRLPSGEQRLVHLSCRATVGIVSNPNNKNTVLAKAGYNRWRGRRPVVRGIAMNPVDHPHGGRTNGGRPSCTPWGIPCKGKRTRDRGKPTRFILVSRHQARRR